jgi:hypothetical protein
MATTARQLGDLISIGPAMLRDFELLRIRSVAQLARQNSQRMYEKLGRVTGKHQVLRSGGSGKGFAAARGAIPVVVLEQEEEAMKRGSKEVKR